MSDNDLIRRGDVAAACQHPCVSCLDAIAALPAAAPTFTAADLERAWSMGRDRSAERAGTYCHFRGVAGQILKSPVVFTTHTWQEIQGFIREISPPADLAQRVKE